jgi:hypothetical protein
MRRRALAAAMLNDLTIGNGEQIMSSLLQKFNLQRNRGFERESSVQ